MRGAAAQRRRRMRRAAKRNVREGLTNAPAQVIAEGLEGSPAVDVFDEMVEQLTTAIAEPVDDVEADDLAGVLDAVTAFADADGDDDAGPADGTKCADCSHPGSMHADTNAGDNMGSCSAQGCDCGGFKTSTTVEDVETADADPSKGFLKQATLTINFDMDAVQRAVAVELQRQLAVDTVTADASGVEIAPPEPTVDHVPPAMRWSGTIALEGTPTDDGRIFAPDALTWRELPLSLGAMFDTPHADVVTASPVIGRIDQIYREGQLIRASGVFDDSDLGKDVARMVGDGVLRGVSVDVAVSEMEVAYKSDILNEDGEWIGGTEPGDKEGPSLLDILFGESDEEVMFVMWKGTIGAVTVCPFPAFADAKIEAGSSLVASTQSEMLWTQTTQAGFTVTKLKGGPSLVASAVPATPPAEWFADPELDGPTPLTITDDGRVFGHAAAWGVCHIGIPGVCTTAPESKTEYAYFHLKEVVCDDGARVPVGTVTLDTGHANPRLGRAEATRHYDDTGTAVADVVCGEDDHGIWLAGAVRADLSDDQLRKLRGATLSGDWRSVEGNLELVALLAVNVPGFPVPRTRAMVASVESEPVVLTLTAAGIQLGQDVVDRASAHRLAALADEAAGTFDDLAAQAEAAAA